jgi:DNA-binding Lrp family transcriptional regulator
MDTTDRILLEHVADGIPLSDHPFREIGEGTGLSETEVIGRLRALREQGVIRRFRARIDQRKTGITANGLVAWKVPPGLVPSIGERMAQFRGVTHCYRRRPVPGRWEYELYTVHHSRQRGDLLKEVKEIAETTGIDTYLVLFSGEEYKRTPTGNLRVAKEQE